MGEAILLTGASGRMGTILGDLLQREQRRIDRCDLVGTQDVLPADIHDCNRMVELCTGKSAVIHLAGASDGRAGWHDVWHTNVEGTYSVLVAALKANVSKVIICSSIHVVGGYPVGTPLSVQLPSWPSSAYGASKVAMEAMASVFAMKTNLSVFCVRVCTFTEKPRNARELRTWFAPEDCADLFNRILASNRSGWNLLWGISGNSRWPVDDAIAAQIGYFPKRNSEVYADDLLRAGIDIESWGDWKTLGGRMTDESELLYCGEGAL